MRVAANTRVEHRRNQFVRPVIPAKFCVALVACKQCAELACAIDRRFHFGNVKNTAVWIAGRIDPSEFGVCRPKCRIVFANNFCAAHRSANDIGRICNLRLHHCIARAETHQQRQPRDEFFRTDSWHDLLRFQTFHTATASEPFDNRSFEFWRAAGRWVPRCV